MKVLFVVLIVAAASQAVKVDWDNLKSLDINPSVPFLRFGNGRVVGGEEATPHQFPYQAGLILTRADGQQAFCGGSLISTKAVLTAAHCIDGIVSIDVILGAHRVREEEPTQVHITSTEFIVHPNWTPSVFYNDIAIIKLPQAVELNENISLINLASHSDTSNSFVDDIATVSGWGRDSDSTTAISPVLRFTSNPVITNLKCFFSFPLLIRRSNICVTSTGGKAACNGDSGGPLTVTIDGVTTQVGLVSFGSKKGCEKGYPAVYTRITSYLDWIATNAGITIN